MKKVHAGKLAFALIILAIIAGVLFLVFQKTNSSNLSAEQIDDRFNCHRITADVRETDVFCVNLKFYNNPDKVTYADYYKYYGCNERLKNGPPTESDKQTDVGFYDDYYSCNNSAKLDDLRQNFIKKLKKLKSEHRYDPAIRF
ncbi:MAG: hypothetical protein ABIS59_00705 [Candidatus Saccharibacteria bacterium]